MRFYLFFLTLLVVACSQVPPSSIPTSTSLRDGVWSMHIDRGDVKFPLTLTFKGDSVHFHNAHESIGMTYSQDADDSIIIIMPIFGTEFHGNALSDSSISGYWHHIEKGPDYKLGFVASFVGAELPKTDATYLDKYEISFSPYSDDYYPAVGMFNLQNKNTCGTFLTETGDYRFLGGIQQKNKLELSCFDGSHLFLFTANIVGDSLKEGIFYSGQSYKEPWEGVRNERVKLTDPDSLTYMLDPDLEFVFAATNSQGDSVVFNNDQYQGKVSIVQIFGSWCPNCVDESLFYQDLYSDFSNGGLQIIPVAFERTDNPENHRVSVNRFKEQLDLEFPFYYGGPANKGVASSKFPMLNKIISFPTSVFIDRKGKVRKVHTGFYGPGTGEYYERYKESTRSFVQTLLAEEGP